MPGEPGQGTLVGVSSVHLIPSDLLGPPHGAGLYEVHEWRNAAAVLQAVYPEEWKDALEVLRRFRLDAEQWHP